MAIINCFDVLSIICKMRSLKAFNTRYVIDSKTNELIELMFKIIELAVKLVNNYIRLACWSV